jgi:hypothetical protein
MLRSWLVLRGRRLFVEVDDRSAAYPVRIDPFIQQGPRLAGAGGGHDEQQGYSVALSGDGNTALIGGNFGADGGATWVFTRSGGVWSQQGPKLIGTGANGDSEQGVSVAISADGNTALIGGPHDSANDGAVWVFTRSGSTWTQQGPKLVGAGAVGPAFQGVSVALSSDGNTALIGGVQDNQAAGAAWVFTRTASTWTQQGQKLVGTGAVGPSSQGSGVALSGDGNTALIGGSRADGVGAAWVFTRAAGTWSQLGSKLVGSGATGDAAQGSSVALSGDGQTALLGGPYDNHGVGAGWVFVRSGSAWAQQGTKLVGAGAGGSAGQGSSAALSSDGSTALLGGPYDDSYAGAAWAFSRSGITWSQLGRKLVGSATSGIHVLTGYSVAVSGDGSTALVGAPGDGADLSGEGAPGAAWAFTLADYPSVRIKAPVGGVTYTPHQIVTSIFACSEGAGGPGIGSCVDQQGNPSGTTLDTSTPGQHTLTVTATSRDGLSETESVTYTIPAPPTAQIKTPQSGATYVRGQLVISSFSCAEGAAGFGLSTCQDQNYDTSGNPVNTWTPGMHTLTVTATSTDGLSATATSTYTVAIPPTAQIAAPVSGATFAQRQVVQTSFTCSEGAGGPGVASCADQHGHASGAALDTSTPGKRMLTVTATSSDGLTGNTSIAYTVIGAPAAQITSPRSNTTFYPREKVATSFTCEDGVNAPGLRSCTDSNGASGRAGTLHTTRAGRHSYSVTATSTDGQQTTSSISYTVEYPTDHFTVSHITPHPGGGVSFEISIPGPGSLDVLETAWNDNFARVTQLLQPAKHRFVFARSHRTARRGGTLHIIVGPGGQGRLLIRHHRYRVTLRLWVTYTPTHGLRRSVGFYGLRVPTAGVHRG